MAHGIVVMTLDISSTVEAMRERVRAHCAHYANAWSIKDNGETIVLTIPPKIFWDSDIWEEARYFQSIGCKVDCPFLKGKPFFD